MEEKLVRAERFELVDRRGQLRAVFTCDKDSGAPSCAFLDDKGTDRLIVGISWNQIPQIQLAAPDGKARVALIVRPEGMGMLVLSDDEQHSRTITPEET